MESIISTLSAASEFFQNYGGLITWLLLALPFLLLLIILAPIYMVRGFKKGTFHGLVSLGCSLVAFVISIFLSKGLATLISSLAFNGMVSKIEGMITSIVPKLEGILTGSSYVGAYIQGLFSAVFATVFFVIFALILLIVLKVVVCKLLNGVLTKDEPGALFRTGGLLIRGVDALLVSFLFLVPLYCLLGSGAALGKNVANAIDGAEQVQQEQASDKSDDSAISSTLNTVCSSISNSPLVKVSMLPGFNFPQRLFCSFKCEGSSYNLYDIFYDGSDLILGGVSLLEKKPAEYGDAEITLLHDLIDTAEENDYFYGLFLDGVRFSDQILLGVMPEEENGTLSEMLFLLIDPFKSCTVDDIKDSASAVVTIFESAIKNEILSDLEGGTGLFEKAANTTFIDDAVTALRTDDLLSSAADNVLILMLDVMAESFDTADNNALADAFDDLKDTVEENVKKGAPDVNSEITALKQIASGMSALGSTEGMNDIEAINVKGISDLMTGLGMHPHVGADAAGALLKDLLPTFVSSDEGSILTDDFINSAVDALIYDIAHPATSKQGKFENLLHTAKNLTVVVSKGTGVTDNREALNDTVDSLLTDMTKESADIITSAITKDVMDSINKNGQTNGNTEDFVKDLIGNMADYDAPSDEDVAREREAVIKMNDLMLDAENKLQNKPDDGTTAIETAVGGDLKGFVNEVSSSTVLMQTVSGAFERNPEKESDPDGFFSNMGEDDKAKLNEVCNEILLDDSISAEQKENVKLLCAFMGGSIN